MGYMQMCDQHPSLDRGFKSVCGPIFNMQILMWKATVVLVSKQTLKTWFFVGHFFESDVLYIFFFIYIVWWSALIIIPLLKTPLQAYHSQLQDSILGQRLKSCHDIAILLLRDMIH